MSTALVYAAAFWSAPTLPGINVPLPFFRAVYVAREVHWVFSWPRLAMVVATLAAFAGLTWLLLGRRAQRLKVSVQER
jgi:hypothetical protein